MTRHAAARGQSYRSPGETPAHPLRLSVSGSAIKDIPPLPWEPSFEPVYSIISGHIRRATHPVVDSGRRPAKGARRTQDVTKRLWGVYWQSALSGFRRHRLAVCYKYRQRYRRSGGMIVEPSLQLSNAL